MSNIIQTTTELAIHMVSGYAKKGGVFTDATCGNGNDTEFLCRMTGEQGRVYAFDIQDRAVKKTAGSQNGSSIFIRMKSGTASSL